MQRRMRIQPRFYIFLIIVMLICFLVSFLVSQAQYERATERLQLLNGEHARLTTRVNELTKKLEYVRSDAYIERVARDELGLIHKGEIRYVTNQ